MRYIFVLVFLITASSFSFAQNADSKTKQPSKAGQEVRKLERAWLDAYEQNDSKAMNEIVADDFVITFPDGSRETKPQILESLKKPRNPSDSLKFYTENVQSRVYGETVILMGRVITEYMRDGKPAKEVSSYTDTYVRRKGRWQVVASHLSNAPKT